MIDFKFVAWMVICHLIGDYVLQSDFIANSKGTNYYHLFVHSALYCAPFALVFGMQLTIAWLFISHMVIDAMKARYNVISYPHDQVMHYSVLVGWLISTCV